MVLHCFDLNFITLRCFLLSLLKDYEIVKTWKARVPYWIIPDAECIINGENLFPS